MAGTIIYRHNSMNVESLDTFVSIKGGYYNGRRDVYFIRALGELPNMGSAVLELDRKMDAAAAGNRLVYRRISQLPVLSRKEDVEFYAKTQQEWKQKKTVTLKHPIRNELLKNTLSEAMKSTLNLYQKAKGICSETMVDNYGAKLWFWCDSLLGELFSQWTERLTVKLVAEDVTKQQEYLFLYMSTLLGCDVLMLNNKSDLKAPEELTRLSHSMKLGSFGQTQIPAYKKPEAPPPAKIRQTQTEQPKSNSVKIPPRPPRTSSNASQLPATPPRTSSSPSPIPPRPPRTGSNPIPPAQPRTSANPAQEKSFEELAQLASSIVLIAVLNTKGEPVATGSGIMIGRSGFILTNHHVVKAGQIFAVRIEGDEKVYPTSEIIKYNSDLDLAVIRIQRELQPLPVYSGRKQLVRGQKVVAIGSPLGLFNSVSDGIISGFRKINGVDMIQFTAPISHGSSGGAVLNMFGEVIGISTAGIDSGQNINLAVDYESIRFFANGFF